MPPAKTHWKPQKAIWLPAAEPGAGELKSVIGLLDPQGMARRHKALPLDKDLLPGPGRTLETNRFREQPGLKRLLAIFLMTPVLLDCARPVLGHAIELGSLVARDIDHTHAAHHPGGLHQPLARARESGS